LRTAARLRQVVADIPEPEITVIGMTYKAESDDMRESPALIVADLLGKDGYRLRQYDPFVSEHGYASLIDAAKGSDLLAILVSHKKVLEELRAKEKTIRAAMRTPRIITF